MVGVRDNLFVGDRKNIHPIERNTKPVRRHELAAALATVLFPLLLEAREGSWFAPLACSRPIFEKISASGSTQSWRGHQQALGAYGCVLQFLPHHAEVAGSLSS